MESKTCYNVIMIMRKVKKRVIIRAIIINLQKIDERDKGNAVRVD